MSALKFSGPVLGEQGEEVRDLYVVDGRITFEPQPGAESAGEGWIVPGLVDAHNHLGLEDGGAVSEEDTLAQALADRDTGALLLRDCGSPADTRRGHERDASAARRRSTTAASLKVLHSRSRAKRRSRSSQRPNSSSVSNRSRPGSSRRVLSSTRMAAMSKNSVATSRSNASRRSNSVR